jgi:hypothetical protein
MAISSTPARLVETVEPVREQVPSVAILVNPADRIAALGLAGSPTKAAASGRLSAFYRVLMIRNDRYPMDELPLEPLRVAHGKGHPQMSVPPSPRTCIAIEYWLGPRARHTLMLVVRVFISISRKSTAITSRRR